MSKQSLEQTAKLSLGIKLAPAQIQAARLIALPTLALNDEIEKELDNNPALDIDTDAETIENDEPIYESEEDTTDEKNDETDDTIPEIDTPAVKSEDDFDDAQDYDYDSSDISDYELKKLNQSKDDKPYEHTAVAEKSFQDSLLEQLAMLDIPDSDREIAEYIIGNINEKGYIDRDNNSLSNDILLTYNINITPEKIEKIITGIIQRLDPPGIGARDLKECLLLQLSQHPNQMPYSAAELLIKNFFDELSKKHYDRIIKRTDLKPDQLNEVLKVIKSLNPYPADFQTAQDKAANYITPDFYITEDENELQLTLNNNYTPKLKINDDFARQYKKMQEAKREQKEMSKAETEANQFVKANVDKAEEFMRSLSIREQTLETTMREIMKQQSEFFRTGDETKLKPMILQDIADKTGYDKSTVSRVTNDKYVQTYFGNISLKSLFSESVGDEDVSSKEIKNIIKQIVEGEDKTAPLNDDKLCAILEKKGYKIARRTIAKYREELKIPVARLRKKL